MKKRMTYKPCALEIVPVSPDGMAPTSKIPAMTLRGPNSMTPGRNERGGQA